MGGIDALNTQAYLAATQSPMQQALAQESKKAEKPSRLSFAEAMKKTKEEEELASEGLPPEIAGMTQDEAVVFLKDAVDVAGDGLKFHQSLENLENYRRKLGQFLKFISKNNYEVITRRRMVGRGKMRHVDTVRQIQVINQKLNQLAADVIYNHKQNLKLLNRIGEINGLIIDLLD